MELGLVVGLEPGEPAFECGRALPEVIISAKSRMWPARASRCGPPALTAARRAWLSSPRLSGRDGPAVLLKFSVDLGSLGEALVPPLADVGLELVQFRCPADVGHQLLGAGGPGVALHGPAVQAGGDLPLRSIRHRAMRSLDVARPPCRVLATSLIGDVAAALAEHVSATLDEHYG